MNTVNQEQDLVEIEISARIEVDVWNSLSVTKEQARELIEISSSKGVIKQFIGGGRNPLYDLIFHNVDIDATNAEGDFERFTVESFDEDEIYDELE